MYSVYVIECMRGFICKGAASISGLLLTYARRPLQHIFILTFIELTGLLNACKNVIRYTILDLQRKVVEGVLLSILIER